VLCHVTRLVAPDRLAGRLEVVDVGELDRLARQRQRRAVEHELGTHDDEPGLHGLHDDPNAQQRAGGPVEGLDNDGSDTFAGSNVALGAELQDARVDRGRVPYLYPDVAVGQFDAVSEGLLPACHLAEGLQDAGRVDGVVELVQDRGVVGTGTEPQFMKHHLPLEPVRRPSSQVIVPCRREGVVPSHWSFLCQPGPRALWDHVRASSVSVRMTAWWW
jgi:hypothetical protein